MRSILHASIVDLPRESLNIIIEALPILLERHRQSNEVELGISNCADVIRRVESGSISLDTST